MVPVWHWTLSAVEEESYCMYAACEHVSTGKPLCRQHAGEFCLPRAYSEDGPTDESSSRGGVFFSKWKTINGS